MGWLRQLWRRLWCEHAGVVTEVMSGVYVGQCCDCGAWYEIGRDE